MTIREAAAAVLSLYLEEGMKRPSLEIGDKVCMSRKVQQTPHTGQHGTIMKLKNSIATVKWHDGDVEEIHINNLHPHGLLEPA